MLISQRMYKILRSFLFLFDPEEIHYFSMNLLRLVCRSGILKRWITRHYSLKENDRYSIFDIQFSNRIGLGAGFDKNAKYLRELEALGFGFVEIGTVTPLPQTGNDKPRLFRVPKDKALINRMGFNNDGSQVITERLKRWRQNSKLKTQDSKLIIGGNIGKNKLTPNENAWKDYETCFLALHDWVDYFVVNVSSPNTAGLRALHDKDSLSKILKNLQTLNSEKENSKPILLKISPDLTWEQTDDVIELATEINLDGLIVSNTTIERTGLSTGVSKLNRIGKGGLSGPPLKDKSTELIRYINNKTNNKLFIVGSGGIFNGMDAVEKISAGASLIQVWTGFIYEGPKIVKNISAYLACKKKS